MIRAMEYKDIDAIRKIDKLCFKDDFSRRTEGIEGYIESSDNSSIVYEIDGKVVGFNFIHIWGSFGWFGPFGVDPKYQSQGIGKTMIKHTIKILKEEYKVSTIGLNTMPESQYNVGFYMSLGFTPHKLSLKLQKQLDFKEKFAGNSDYEVEEVNISDESEYINIKNDLKNLSCNILNDFDLTSELYMIKYKNFGTAFKLKVNTKVEGILICYTKFIREFDLKCIQIKVAAIDKNLDYKKAIDSMIDACTKYAEKIGYNSISIDCNTYNEEICNYLISQHKFKIQKTQVMMLMGGDNPFINDKIHLLTRLAG
ncbi:GNAT family N-acetyltransferase [Inconstantimicrobium mannanitabidum]|uniref:Uncharacterized protein n=1 Tax=Inconstantimicrobium mannanitabidum TaxID=1604901 RepID=A0ACB5RDK5_9CLOT|nr:N-acetyltransferase [Clostridium sp. TW13]GKX67350.1 hypothetical protein rsdtw13_26080 [Clostridium sp. TW13]